jgi:hypothetical protein
MHTYVIYKQASRTEDACSFSAEKFRTTFDSIWKSDVTVANALVFYYTSIENAKQCRKSGIHAYAEFKGVPVSLRRPHDASSNDFEVFGGEMISTIITTTTTSNSKRQLSYSENTTSTNNNSNNNNNTPNKQQKKFPNEEVLVLSLPRKLLQPLNGYEDDEGLCFISSKVLNALRPTSYTEVEDSHPWLEGYCLLPPQCIIRSFKIMKFSSANRSSNDKNNNNNNKEGASTLVPKASFIERTSSMRSMMRSMRESSNNDSIDETAAIMMNQNNKLVKDDCLLGTSTIELITSIKSLTKELERIRFNAEEEGLIPLYHYTSPSVAPLILKGGLRMSTQGQGDGGVYVSTQGPASYGIGSQDYETNIIRDCFGVERLHEYLGKGYLDVIIIYGCEADIFDQV